MHGNLLHNNSCIPLENAYFWGKMIWTLMEKPNVTICTVETLDELTEWFQLHSITSF